MFEETSRDSALIVTVEAGGGTEYVQVEEAAMGLTETEFCNRVIRLNTLAYLKSQLAIRQKWEANGKQVLTNLPTEMQVQRYAATIDF
ncbi:hypothetical protein [Mycobacteroides abscessus]|uniref:hypothetical protein n=1 Tax=Mycobacteroides abscessus TaxID=36809 RepID=UPI000925A119|nr:hypothetical protein [Mycobacteroides abscessus]SIK91990.1 Uncharacterised protein [Mycobacteroides abscessus subsp. abscessus]SIN02721.1 Uncharacterised protein [Mycobacteroides abscessus subsp. abscessus]SIN09949.1 Uncharacterised protein [Mycobacteroides abscessus subsp. abscessus]